MDLIPSGFHKPKIPIQGSCWGQPEENKGARLDWRVATPTPTSCVIGVMASLLWASHFLVCKLGKKIYSNESYSCYVLVERGTRACRSQPEPPGKPSTPTTTHSNRSLDKFCRVPHFSQVSRPPLGSALCLFSHSRMGCLPHHPTTTSSTCTAHSSHRQ